jgi:hypothetical protein
MNDQPQPNPIQTEKPRNAELPRRITFLLRLWCVDESGRSNWRASLELPEFGQRLGFATLEQMFVYLLDYCEGRVDV